MPRAMHPDEVPTDEALVAQLVAAQFTRGQGLPIVPVRSSGTDNVMYRLGEHWVVRLPRLPALPLAIPTPIALGAPLGDFPHPWSVYTWLEGENATVERLDDLHDTATLLADFVRALRGVDAAGGPAPGVHNSFRGVPLAERDGAVRAALAALSDEIDVEAASAAWGDALEAPSWQGAPVWIHGDLQSGNLLAVGGELSAVIDFGCLGVGDPACDLAVAWNLLPRGARATFRARLGVEDAEWARGRGWALSIGLIALPYYQVTNPTLAGIARRAISEVLAERRH